MMRSDKNIEVTKTFLPPMDEFQEILKESWELSRLTNGGPLIYRLMDELKSYLDAPHMLITTNGTIALQVAIKSLGLKGDIITTPFSYIATSSSIIWEGCNPVYVDIDPITWNIDPDLIEDRITDRTSAILATHVFGNPCDVDRINNIAKRYDLKVIYDAAHCFGVKYKGESILNFGDISMCSFHATKIFHTGEGGCLVSRHPDLIKKCLHSHNFGHDGTEAFHGLGINGKASEFQAAMGLALLPYMHDILLERKKVVNQYKELLSKSKFQTITIGEAVEWNYSYFPVLFQSENSLKKALEALSKCGIFPRRYFYPSLNKVGFIDDESMPVAESIAERILCLPLYVGLQDNIIQKIVDVILECE